MKTTTELLHHVAASQYYKPVYSFMCHSLVDFAQDHPQYSELAKLARVEIDATMKQIAESEQFNACEYSMFGVLSRWIDITIGVTVPQNLIDSIDDLILEMYLDWDNRFELVEKWKNKTLLASGKTVVVQFKH